TLRRHIEAVHSVPYNTWCAKNDFVSKLPKATKIRNEAKKAAEAAKQQSSIEPHLEERKVKERVIPYSDALFKQAAIEWLIATDQPLQALEHPKFHEMIAVASRAPK
ncbi:hypothetical protein HYPSUDRAFT_116501, partial [Hypholoma sublateritium FD-334 SS-4]